MGIAEDSRTGIETGKICKTIPFAVQTDNLVDYTHGLPSQENGMGQLLAT